jgi:hypothetical protein
VTYAQADHGKRPRLTEESVLRSVTDRLGGGRDGGAGSALHLAVVGERKAIVEMLLKSGVDLGGRCIA